MLSLYEANLSPEFIMMTRMFGLTLLSTCVVLWYARRSENQLVIELTSRANILYWLLGSIVILIAQINGLYNWVAWGTFGFHAFFFLWYVYKMFIRP
jgi:hypothetical protein